ncbi:uncharacterized protein BP01DRAFT_33188 [Aspergillus saccharolyticus JOP 1030-1]|uniref:Uncharacterized protein n=1 Tax=Aspergillus saccharolyticus JOP 1030-1 TaxID=1450539 RepID=A0A319AHE5_9EURO|nr:hypothetical protein BP01DRAFT_33188 [Aspergillus saccharolyticus JOP 1030-1]PYH46022.1 hypothetical protein BP01DRAFT_33188 [Aspergillus saccharolyticus JOP 1030-1]
MAEKWGRGGVEGNPFLRLSSNLPSGPSFNLSFFFFFSPIFFFSDQTTICPSSALTFAPLSNRKKGRTTVLSFTSPGFPRPPLSPYTHGKMFPQVDGTCCLAHRQCTRN